MYAIAVNKSQELLLNVRRLFLYFFDDDARYIRLRRRVRVDVFYHDVVHRPNYPLCELKSLTEILSLRYIFLLVCI